MDFKNLSEDEVSQMVNHYYGEMERTDATPEQRAEAQALYGTYMTEARKRGRERLSEQDSRDR
jgi:hypothetical protein